MKTFCEWYRLLACCKQILKHYGGGSTVRNFKSVK